MDHSTLIVLVNSQDIPDFYRMLQDFGRNRGNTFAYLQRELEERYPKLKEFNNNEDTKDQER